MSFRTESKLKTVHKSSVRIFNFISDFRNFQHLLPPDKIENWSCTEGHCSFTLKGLTQLSLHVAEKKPFSLVKFSSVEGSKFPFDLFVEMSEESEEGKVMGTGEKSNPETSNEKSVCKVYMDLHMSPAIKVLAGKALQNFVDMLADKLEETKF